MLAIFWNSSFFVNLFQYIKRCVWLNIKLLVNWKMLQNFVSHQSRAILTWAPYRKPAFWIVFLAILLPFIIPVIHMNIFAQLWQRYNRKIDRKTCSCSCWDTVFKGNFWKPAGVIQNVFDNKELTFLWQETMKQESVVTNTCTLMLQHNLQKFGY